MMPNAPFRSLRFAMATRLGSVVASLVVVASIVAPTATAQDENAYDAWRRLFDVISPNWDDPEGARSPGFFTDDEYDAIFEWQDGPLEAPRGAARRYFEKAESIAPLIRDLRGTPRFDAGIDLSDGFMVLLPHLKPMREISRVSSHLARRATIAGDVDAAVEWLGTSNEISAHSGQDGTALGSLVGAAMYRRSDQTMELAIANGLINVETAANLLDSLASLREGEDPFHFGACVDGERLLFMQSIDAILGKNGAPPVEADLELYRDAFGDEFIESFTRLPDAGDELRDRMTGVFDRIQLAFDDPDRDRGIDTLAALERELAASDLPEALRMLIPSMTQIARARLRVERALDDRIRGLDAVASGRISPDQIRNAAILWAQIGRSMLTLPDEVQQIGLALLEDPTRLDRAGLDPHDADSPATAWRDAFGPMASNQLTLGLDAAAIVGADFDGRRGPQSETADRLGAVRAAARGFLADAADRLRRATSMPVDGDGDSTPEDERFLAANEIAVTISLAAHLIRDPGIARLRLAAAVLEDIADLLAGSDAQAMRLDPVLRMLIADAAAKLPRLDGLDASTAARLDAARFTAARLRDLRGDAADAATASLAEIPPGRLYSIFAIADDRMIATSESTPPPEAAPTDPFANLGDLLPYRGLADSEPSTAAGPRDARAAFQDRLAEVRDRPAEAGRLLGTLELGPALPIRRAADAAMIRITDIDDFCKAPAEGLPPGD